MALPASDAFTGTNGTALTTYSANWTYNKGTFAINSNALHCGSDGYDCAAHWNADTFSNDQYSKATVTAIAPGSYIGVAVRCHASAETWYEVICNSNDACYFYKVVAGTGTALAADTAVWSVNDVIEIRAVGTTISWYKNSVLQQSVTDTSIASGYAGVAGSGNSSVSRIDNWEGGNLGGAAALTISVSDSTTLSETVTCFTNILHRSVSDSATVSESVSRQLIGNRSVSDSATVSDSVTVAVSGGISTFTVSVSDSATVSDTPALLIPALTIATSDATTVTDTRTVTQIAGVGITGVLTVSANPRYFENNNGIVVLTGFHTWYTMVDGGVSDPPPTFDYEAWLDFCATRGGNTFKLWAHETPKDWPDEANTRFVPLPWARTGPGNAADGKLKFDLDTWDQTYFDRMRARAIAAGNRGFYVVIQLFQGWQADAKGLSPGTPVVYHPFADGNNINSVDGNTDDDADILEIRNTANTAIYNRQKAYVEKVVDTINDLDNVLLEISNEETATATVTAWQHALIDYIHTYESGKPKQHPVGMTWQWPSGSNATDLYTSNADWISYGGNDSTPLANPPAWPDTGATGFVSLWDTDHMGGLVLDSDYMWRAFMRGHNVLFMDSYDGTFGDDWTANATAEIIRNNLGYIQDYAARLDLANVTPQGALASTAFALAKTTAGQAQLLIYQDGTGAFDVYLTSIAGEFTLEWLRVSDGTVQAGSNVNGSATRTLTPPWAGDVVAFLEQLALILSVSESVTVSDAPTLLLANYVVSVTDSATVADAPALTVVSAGQTIVTVADSAAATDAPTLVVLLGGVSIADSAGVADAPTVAAILAGINVSDSSAVSDAPTVAVILAGISVTESITVTDSVSVVQVEQGVYAVSVSESVTLSETVTVAALLGDVLISDSVTTSETVTRALSVTISASDSAALGEVLTLAAQLAGINVNDNVSLAESVAFLLDPLLLSVSDSATVGEAITLGQDLMLINVSDGIAVSDIILMFVGLIVTPDSRIYAVAQDNRTYAVARDNRTYAVAG